MIASFLSEAGFWLVIAGCGACIFAALFVVGAVIMAGIEERRMERMRRETEEQRMAADARFKVELLRKAHAREVREFCKLVAAGRREQRRVDSSGEGRV